jgi:transcriptional regulator with XRE-family HTH domain
MLKLTFGERLRKLRVNAGLTQPELASGITSVSHVSLIESNKRQPSDEIVVNLASRLGVPVDFLREGPESESNQNRRKDYIFAEISFKNGDTQFAQTLLEKVIQQSSYPTDTEFEVKVQLLYAQIFEKTGDLERASKELQTAISLAESAGLPLQVIEMTITLSKYAKESGDFVTALELIENVEKAVPYQLQKSATYARLLSSKIAIHYLRGDYIRANDISQNAMAIFDDQTDPVARASIYWNASLAADAIQDSTQALLLAQRAAGLFSESDDARTEGTLRVAIAWLLTRQTPPDVEGARSQLDRAHTLLIEHGTTVDITYYQIELARVEWLSGNHEEALQISTSAIANTDPMKDRLQRADAYLLAARSQISLGHKADSSMNLLAARGSLLEMEPSRQNALAWRELGDIYSGLGHLEDAIDAYREALQEAGVPASPLAFSEFERAKEKIVIRKKN